MLDPRRSWAIAAAVSVVLVPVYAAGLTFLPDRSGAGSDVFAADINKDGLMDIVTATRFGAFIFWGQRPGRK